MGTNLKKKVVCDTSRLWLAINHKPSWAQGRGVTRSSCASTAAATATISQPLPPQVPRCRAQGQHPGCLQGIWLLPLFMCLTSSWSGWPAGHLVHAQRQHSGCLQVSLSLSLQACSTPSWLPLQLLCKEPRHRLCAWYPGTWGVDSGRWLWQRDNGGHRRSR